MLVNNWPHNNPRQEDTFKAASYFLFWLLHERSVGGIEKISPKQCVDKYVIFDKYTELLMLALKIHNYDFPNLNEADIKHLISILFLSNELDFTKAFKTLSSFQELFTHDESEIELQLQSVKIVFEHVLENLSDIFAPLKNAAKLFGDRIEFRLIPQSVTAQQLEPNLYHLSDEELGRPFIAKIFQCKNGIVQNISSFYPQDSSCFKESINTLIGSKLNLRCKNTVRSLCIFLGACVYLYLEIRMKGQLFLLWMRLK